MDLAQITQENTFEARDAVAPYVVVERDEALPELSCDRFGPYPVAADPGMLLRKEVEGRVQKSRDRFVPGHVLETCHAFLEGNALGLHLLDELGLARAHLGLEQRARIFEDRFRDRDHVEGVVGGRGIEGGDGVDEIERERVVEPEITLESRVDAGHGAGPPAGVGVGAGARVRGLLQLDDPRMPERTKEHRRFPAQSALSHGGLEALVEELDQLTVPRARKRLIGPALEQRNQHRMAHGEL